MKPENEVKLKYGGWGLVLGAGAAMIVGFSWGGWTLQSTAQKMADQKSGAAVVAALTPICVDRFNHAADATATLAALKKVDSWQQDGFVTKGGWATFPGTEPNRDVAEACAKVLNGQK